jgi:hypothetical protein
MTLKYVENNITIVPCYFNYKDPKFIKKNLFASDVCTFFDKIIDRESDTYMISPTYAFCIDFSFETSTGKFNKGIFINTVRLLGIILNNSSQIISNDINMIVDCGAYFNELNCNVNFNHHSHWFVKNQQSKMIKYANRKYGFDIKENRESDKNKCMIPDGFFESLDERIRQKYENAIYSTHVEIKEDGDVVNIVFPDDVTLAKLIITLECAQEYYDTDKNDDIRVFVEGTLYANDDLLLEYGWTEYVEKINRLVTNKVDPVEVGNHILTDIFVNVYEADVPDSVLGPRYSTPKIYWEPDKFKNKDVQLQSNTHMLEFVKSGLRPYYELIAPEDWDLVQH